MIKKTPLMWLIAGLVTVLAIIFSGCSTEKPWATNPNAPLVVTLISGPSDSLSVPIGSVITFTWTYSGGQGTIQYQYKLDAGDWSSLSKDAVNTIRDLALGAHNFSVRAIDAVNATSEITATFVVIPEPNTNPTVAITGGPAENSFVATGGIISFSWEGDDATSGQDYLLYQYSFAGVTSDWVPARTVSFNNVVAANPAIFTVKAKDLIGNESIPDSVSFIIHDATILYVDDYLWLDSFGNTDEAKEREQKGFYRDALTGYAFAEWDIAAQGMPDSSYITNFSTVIFASDSNVGDASTTWWYDVGDVDGGVLRYYMEHGGHLLAIGANILQWIYNTNPPAAGDFEYDWFGIDSTLGWDYWSDFTWAINTGNLAGLPDSMKIDVAKNGTQVDYAENIFAFRDSAVVLYTKGLDIDGAAPEDYGESVGHIFYPNHGAARTALIDFDGFSMPGPGMRQTLHTILDQFGEGPGL